MLLSFWTQSGSKITLRSLDIDQLFVGTRIRGPCDANMGQIQSNFLIFECLGNVHPKKLRKFFGDASFSFSSPETSLEVKFQLIFT